MKSFLKSLPLIIIASCNIFADQDILNFDKKNCFIPDEIMLSLLHAEKHIEKDKKKKNYPVGYEYFIRINGKNNLRNAVPILVQLMDAKVIKKVNKYLYDCLDKETCVKTVQVLEDYDITNLDLGPYQTNLFWHPYSIESYFSLETSYLIACNYEHQLINQYGWSWETIAKYHSKTPKHNKRYKKILLSHYDRLTKDKQ